ncbi:TIGR03545 family protein [Colwellia sp. Bg11-28]|uniref:TIGR03545 family protein n=1 Tax=Colwellia sp. Bg11-28 TaxID=2058305 RepID=UPI000C336B51|nr:TIGR03545 family protein [Colwellia sp. Bg11-28]PKH85246.1 TIGR03545 family protein [Colwellia sp. Bg11-28]
MARFIRWQGMVAFVLLSALVAGLLYLFAESLVKSAIVSSAESAFGAEVNVAEVQLGYSPLQLSVLGLQVTDKDSPTQNLFSFERATAAVDVWQYLFGKIIIDELEVSQLAFSGVRSQAGKVYVDDVSDKAEESLSDQAKAMLPEVDMQLPDIKALLDDSNLLTVKASNELKNSYKVEQAKLKALKTQLPSKAKLKSYQDKVEALGKMKVSSLADIEKIKTEFDKIKVEFKTDQALIKKAKEQVLNSKEVLAQQIDALKNAPTKDWQQIEKKYQLDSIDTEDFAHILFGEKARGYVQKAQWAYEQISPLMTDMKSDGTTSEVKSHADGRFIFFKEDSPLPAILIKKALFSIKLEQGEVKITGSELTHQHWIRGKDSLININSIDNGELKLSSNFKLTQSGEFSANGEWLVNNRTLSNTELTQSKALSLSLSAGILDGIGSFSVVNGDVEATNQFSLKQASYQGEAESKITKLLLDTIKSLDSLTVDVGVNGELSKPSFTIASSLNDALTGAFKQQVSAKLDGFKKKVNKGLNEKLSNALKLGDSQSAELLDLEALLTDSDKALADLKNSDIVKQQQKKLEDKVKDKAKDKLKDKLGDLFG